MWIAHLILLALSFVNSFQYKQNQTKKQTYKTMEGFVVGGDFADIRQFPHSAYLAISCHTSSAIENWACGSSIVNQKILLTAAHCLEYCLQSSFVGVGVGSEHKKKGITYKASKFIIHPDYNSRLIINDIAIVHLSTTLKFGMNVKRVVLMWKPPYKEPADVAGWGLINEKQNLGTFVLKTTKQKVWERSDCEDLLYTLPKGTFCAGNGYPGKKKLGHAAEGDSGSALVVRGFIQIGLVSYKSPAISKSVVVYTDVAYFLEWIRKTARELYCQHV